MSENVLFHQKLYPLCISMVFRLWINSGVRQWRGHDVATGALFGVPSDVLIWPHFHSQATHCAFCSGGGVLGVCQ